jgi:type II secretory pathway component PulF
LSLSADVVDNVVYKNIINEAVKVVNEGGSLADGLRGNDYYVTPVALQMIFVGEESGNLEGVLDTVAIFYTREIDNTVKNLSTIIEPMMMVVLGLAVGLFVASVIMPMWQLSSAF